MCNERLYQIMKEKDAIYAKEDFTDEDGMKILVPYLLLILMQTI